MATGNDSKNLSFALSMHRNVCSLVTIYMTSKLNGVRTGTQLSTVCNSCHSSQHSFGLGSTKRFLALSGN